MTQHFTDASGTSHTPERWRALAISAATSVNHDFGHPLMRLPGTWIGAITTDAAIKTTLRTPWSDWHYWWQAHYLDALIDTSFLYLEQANRVLARQELQRAQYLLRGIMLRNFGRFPNFYYDDMAWLALAARRLNELSLQLTALPAPLARFAANSLNHQLHSAHDSVLGGGLYWSRKRDFKNTPVNGPAALHFALTGQTETARAITDWLRRELFNPETGLYIDGVHPAPHGGRNVEHTIYTYNQGPILAALLTLGEPHHLAQAAQLVEAIRTQLRTPGAGIRLEPGGDGSLFTGILCRYLSQAAHDSRLPAHTRETASYLIAETAAQVSEHSPQQLSAAVQRWMIISAAASL